MHKTLNRSHKYFWLDEAKINRAQKALGAKTQTETIDRALDFVISEAQKNRRFTQPTKDPLGVVSKSRMSLAR